ncbi:MAG TPA: trehalose-phosphatase [Acidimicrobiales bacterium]|nr:trehalose-phosphatase [Acidimicrobiales bacterium]
MDDFVACLTADPSNTGIFSDFDGTLARIVDDPADAEPVEGAVELLAALSRRFKRVGVISGRPAAFLLDRLANTELFLSGLYGMETVEGGDVVATDEAARWRPVVADVAARAGGDLPPGLHVEDKGLSVTIHYRRAPERAGDARRYAEHAAVSTGLTLHEARLSFELAPPVGSSKGTVLAEAAQGLGATCFIGDDRGDLTAFDALDDLTESGTIALRVAVDSLEAPPELLERADLVVEGPEAVVALLQRLL